MQHKITEMEITLEAATNGIRNSTSDRLNDIQNTVRGILQDTEKRVQEEGQKTLDQVTHIFTDHNREVDNYRSDVNKFAGEINLLREFMSKYREELNELKQQIETIRKRTIS